MAHNAKHKTKGRATRGSAIIKGRINLKTHRASSMTGSGKKVRPRNQHKPGKP